MANIDELIARVDDPELRKELDEAAKNIAETVLDDTARGLTSPELQKRARELADTQNQLREAEASLGQDRANRAFSLYRKLGEPRWLLLFSLIGIGVMLAVTLILIFVRDSTAFKDWITCIGTGGIAGTMTAFIVLMILFAGKWGILYGLLIDGGLIFLTTVFSGGVSNVIYSIFLAALPILGLILYFLLRARHRSKFAALSQEEKDYCALKAKEREQFNAVYREKRKLVPNDPPSIAIDSGSGGMSRSEWRAKCRDECNEAKWEGWVDTELDKSFRD